MHKLSIIIPAYNAEPYIEHLIQRLKPQIREEIEVLVIDDGSRFPYLPPYEWVRVIRQENKGLAGARNTGIENTDGEYIHFIDADDLVPENYADYILKLIEEEEPDFIELSWKSFDEKGRVRFDYKIPKNGTLPNPSACTRIYKRSFLGELRFNEKKDTAEDEDLYRRMDFSKGKKAVATEYMYFYRTSTPNSLSKRYRRGETHTKRMVYYYSEITKDMKWLIDEVKKEREENEVVILAHKNALPELEKYAAVMIPQKTYAHILKGEKTNLVKVVEMPIKTQICIYTHNTYKLGGLETFTYNFVRNMSPYYDILILYDIMDDMRIKRLLKYVPVMKNDPSRMISCETLILNRIFDKIPQNVTYNQSIQMVHGCRDCVSMEYNIPQDRDRVICVSETVKESFGEQTQNATVLHNLTFPEKNQSLILISATRLDTPEKGQKRMVALAKELKNKGISFIWLIFANRPLPDATPEMVFMEPVADVRPFIKKADYLVQLSDSEAFCYSMIEALEEGTAVITTPLPVLDELNIRDGKEGYIFPFDMQNIDVNKLLKVPKVRYKYDNESLIEDWRNILGDTTPLHDYKPEEEVVVKIITQYRDMEIGRVVKVGEIISMPKNRAMTVCDAGYGMEV